MLELGLTGKRAIVAGAGPGLGRSCALGLAEAGASVVSIDIDLTRAEAVAAEVRATGGRGIALGADVRRSAQADAAIAQAVDRLGGVDVVVDIIGEIRWGRAVDLTDEDWDYSLDSVVRHFFNLGRTAGRQMLTQNTGGAIVGVSSVSGLASAPFHAPYGAGKAAVMSLTRSLAVEFAPHSIRVNCVAPGAIATPRVAGRLGGESPNPESARPPRSRAPMGRMGAPDEIAKVVVFLCSDLASYVSGQTIAVDGAATAQFVMGPMRADQLPDNAVLDQPPP